MPGTEHLDQITMQTRRGGGATEPRVSPGMPATIAQPSQISSVDPLGTLTESVDEPRRADPDLSQVVLDEVRELGDFHCVGAVWVLSCNNAQTQALSSSLGKLGQHFGAPIESAVAVASDYIAVVNAIGGHHGVDIDGIVGLRGVIVTPHGSRLFERSAGRSRCDAGLGEDVRDGLEATMRVIRGADRLTGAASWFCTQRVGPSKRWLHSQSWRAGCSVVPRASCLNRGE